MTTRNPSPVTEYLGIQPSMTAILLGCGFVGGLLCGIVLLLSRPSGPPPQPAVSKFHTPERLQHADPSSKPATEIETLTSDAQDVETDKLLAEQRTLEAELETLQLKQELAALQQRMDRIQTSSVSAAPSPAAASPPAASADDSPTASQTLAYWNQVNEVIEQEARIRSTPLGGITSSNAGNFFQARIRAAEFAVEGLRELDTTRVDPRATTVARKVADWYADGRDVAATGLELLTSASPADRKGSRGQQYQAAETAHSQAVEQVNAQGEAVRRQLSADYGVDFPPLK